MYKIKAKKISEGIYSYYTWDNEKMLILGAFLFSNVMAYPQQVINTIKKNGDTYLYNTHYAEYTEKGIEIGDIWDEITPIYIPYDKFILFMEKWKIFINNNDEPNVLVITMDDQYNIEFSYKLNGIEKRI